jgi:multidrug transporter EmrE-like cation transporter
MEFILISALSIRVLMDICFKLSVQNVQFESARSAFGSFKKVVFSWAFFVAMLTSALNFLLWMMVLSHYDLSFAYPLFGICFALIMLSGKLFFGESLDRYKMVGIGFILLSSLVLVIG